MSSRRGICFVAWGERCVAEVLDVLRESALPALPRWLVTDRESSVDEGAARALHLQVIRAGFELEGKLRKCEMLAHLPPEIDTWLFLDSDVRVLESLELGFEAAERHGLALALAPHCTLHSFRGFGEVMDAEGEPRLGQAQYNTGVIFFRRDEEVAQVFEAWRELCRRHRAEPHSDQPYFSLALERLGRVPYTLTGAFNYRGVGELISGPVRIWHSRDPFPPDLNARAVADQPRRMLHGRIHFPAGPPLPGARALLAVAVLALLLATAFAAAAGHAIVAVLASGLALGLVAARDPLARHRRALQALLAGTSLLLLLFLPELALRASGRPGGSGAQVGPPRAGAFFRFRPDPELLWTRDPADADVSSWGFPGPEVAAPRAEKARGLLFLGDSCMAQGYPEMVGARLERELAGRGVAFEVVTLAVQGYSSLQGRRVAARHADTVAPGLALICYGWNDHWLAAGAPDAERTAIPPAGGLLRSSRLAAWIAEWLRARAGASAGATLRVSPEEYEENLEALRLRFASRGVPVVFLTAPSAHPALGVPSYLVAEHFLAEPADGLRLHREYNEIVRRVAAREGAHLVDLEARLAALPGSLQSRIFKRDGIHFTPAGLALVAEEVAGFLLAEGLVR